QHAGGAWRGSSPPVPWPFQGLRIAVRPGHPRKEGDPPGNDMWLTYSGNKEDIWISRVPVPIRYKIEGPVEDTFDSLTVGGKIPDWNIYAPRWAPAGIAAFPNARNRSLQLEDKDPYDYARAVRVFAE